MDYEGRGWREERTVWTRDTTGHAMPVTTGITSDEHGALVAAIAIGTGPTAILGILGDGDIRMKLGLNITEALEDLEQQTKQDQARRGRR